MLRHKIVFMGIFVLFSSQLLAYDDGSCPVTYAGVLGSGDQAIAIVKRGSGPSLYLKKGTSLRCGSYVVTSIKRNEIILKNTRNTMILHSQGNQVASNRITNSEEKVFAAKQQEVMQDDIHNYAEESYSKLMEMGQELIDSGEVSMDEINNAVANERQAFDDLKVTDDVLRSKSMLPAE